MRLLFCNVPSRDVLVWGWLGTQDSNLDLRSQSPLSYH